MGWLDVKASKRFERASGIANSCANEGSLISGDGQLDCDFCPRREECVKFWDTHVVEDKATMKKIIEKFEEFQKLKDKLAFRRG